MSNSTFIPTDDQVNFIIQDYFEDIKDQCIAMQEELNCDDDYVKHMLISIVSTYTESKNLT